MDLIPNEILLEIFAALADVVSPRCIITAPSFAECLHVVRNAHAVMLGTSSRWRALSLSNSRLWTTIPITTRCDRSYIDTMLTRCDVHPLTILFRANRTSIDFMLGAFKDCPISLWLFRKPGFSPYALDEMKIRNLRIDSSSVNYYFEEVVVCRHFRSIRGLRVHWDLVRASDIPPKLRTLALRRTLPGLMLKYHGKRLKTLILRGIHPPMYKDLKFSLPRLRSIIISPPESEVGDPLVFDPLEVLTLPALQTLDLHTLQEWPTASTSAFFTRSACKLTTLRLRLPQVMPDVLTVLTQCDETLVDVSLLGSLRHDLPYAILDYVAGESSNLRMDHHLPQLRRLAFQTSSAQVEPLERMFFIRVIKWREMGVAMLESCRLFVNGEDHMARLRDVTGSAEDAGGVVEISCER